jgi:excisionase family DNA binding protein
MSSVLEHGPITATADEHAALQQLERLLAATPANGAAGPKLVTAEGDEIELPASILRALDRLVLYLAHNQEVEVVPVSKELTPQEAADILGVPTSYIHALVEEDYLPTHRTGTELYVALEDLLTFMRPGPATRRQALRELTELSQELGLYDE